MPTATVSLRERAIQALTRSEKTRAQLRTLLLRHGTPDAVEVVLDTLEAEKLLSDTRAAEARVRKAHQKGHAQARILQDLETAGVSSQDAARAVAEALDGVDERGALAGQAAALLGRSPSSKDRQRVARRLLRMGFGEEDVARVCGLEDLADPSTDGWDGP